MARGTSHSTHSPELTLGRNVGQGGFSNVSDILAIDIHENSDAKRRGLAQQANAPESSFVLKTLRSDLPDEEHAKGVLDLAIEADFLKVLSHPHIITMRGMADTDPHLPGFFVVLDRLLMTLDRRFNYWRKIVGENAGYWVPCYGYCCAKAPVLHQIWKERLVVALNMAQAIQYLHQQQIIYRDLKPDNIGFDQNNQLKIFDFGLAKRLDDVERTDEGLYKLTGNTGSLRYMAPEVANDEAYDLSVDIYSFGIIFWQICSLTTPFAGYNQKLHAERVVRQGHRPKPDSSWPMSWVALMTECWSQDRAVRPTMDAVVSNLEERVKELSEDDGIIPTRASEIRAKRRKKKKTTAQSTRLDVDTRISTEVDSPNNKRFENDIV